MQLRGDSGLVSFSTRSNLGQVNCDHRQELIRITRENQSILKRIQQAAAGGKAFGTGSRIARAVLFDPPRNRLDRRSKGTLLGTLGICLFPVKQIEKETADRNLRHKQHTCPYGHGSPESYVNGPFSHSAWMPSTLTSTKGLGETLFMGKASDLHLGRCTKVPALPTCISGPSGRVLKSWVSHRSVHVRAPPVESRSQIGPFWQIEKGRTRGCIGYLPRSSKEPSAEHACG